MTETGTESANCWRSFANLGIFCNRGLAAVKSFPPSLPSSYLDNRHPAEVPPSTCSSANLKKRQPQTANQRVGPWHNNKHLTLSQGSFVKQHHLVSFIAAKDHYIESIHHPCKKSGAPPGVTAVELTPTPNRSLSRTRIPSSPALPPKLHA